MNAISTFAIEHLYITNSGDDSEICREEEWLPSTSTTDEFTSSTVMSSTTTSSIITESTTEEQTSSSSSSSSSSSTETSTTIEPSTTTTSTSISSSSTLSEPSSEEESTTTDENDSTTSDGITTELPPTQEPNKETMPYVLLIIVTVISLAIIIIGCALLAYVHRRQKYVVTPRDSIKDSTPLPSNNEIFPTALYQNMTMLNSERTVTKTNEDCSVSAPVGTILITGENSAHNNPNNLRIAAWMLEMDKNSSESQQVVDQTK